MQFRRQKSVRRITLSSITLAVLALASQAGAQQVADKAGEQVQKVEITGSTIKRIASEAALPVTSIKFEEVASAGITTVADLMTSLSVGSTNVPSSAGAGTNVNLRGIGINRTLVLLNGRRLANEPLSDGYVNVDLIPMSAMNRVEVLRDGASSTYGTDAIGGVVNFITKRTYKGLEVTAQTVTPQMRGGGQEQRVSTIGGIGDLQADGWNLYATVDAHRRSTLYPLERPDLGSAAVLAELGFTPKPSASYSHPANVTWNSAKFTGNPYYATGCAAPYSVPMPAKSPAATNGNPGCTIDKNYIPLLPANQQISFFSQGKIKLGDDRMITAELLHSKEYIRTEKAPNTTVMWPVSALTPLPAEYTKPITITTASKWYPGGSGGVPALTGGTGGAPLNVLWSVAELGATVAQDEQKTTRLALTDEGKFQDWDYRLGFVYGATSRDSYFVKGYLNGLGLASGVLSGALNPFGFQDAVGKAYLDSISMDGNKIRHTTSVYTGVDVTFTRELMQLGGGPLTLATGGDFHHDGNEDRSMDVDIFVPYQARLPNRAGGNRNIAAVFAEVDLPITKELNLDLAVRADRYTDFGGTVNPKASFRYQPAKMVMFRGSASTGFRAPTLFDRYGYRLPGATTSTTDKWDDPLLCPNKTALPGYSASVVCNAKQPLQNGSNPEVKPETSRNFTLGTVIDPVKDLSISLDYFNIHINDAIGALPQNAIFNNTAKYADLFVRDANKNLLYVVDTNQNLGELNTSGIDVGVFYALPKNELGNFKMSLVGTYVLNFESQNEKDGIWISNLGRFGSNGSANVNPSPTYTFRWKHTMSLSWASGDWFSQLTNNYNTGYHDANNPAQVASPAYYRDIKPYSIWNATVAYRGIKNTTVVLGVTNLANTPPPLTNSNTTLGYASNISSPIGRAINARVTYEF